MQNARMIARIRTSAALSTAPRTPTIAAISSRIRMNTSTVPSLSRRGRAPPHDRSEPAPAGPVDHPHPTLDRVASDRAEVAAVGGSAGIVALDEPLIEPEPVL